MTDNTRALLEQALEAFQHITTDGTGKSGKQIVQDICAVEVAIRAELAKPEEQAEPVAWLYSVPGHRSAASCERIPLDMTPRGTAEAPLYLHPPTPAWHDAPEVATLKAERDEAMKDAERYRWLTRTSDTNKFMVCDTDTQILYFGWEADEAIDAAIAKAEEKNHERP